MKALKFVALIALMAFVAWMAWTPGIRAAESFTVTAVGSTDITDVGTGWSNSFKVLKIEFKTNATDGTMANQTIPAMKGKVLMGVTNPGADAPDANYDIYILDTQGVDIFGGALNNRHTSASEQATPHINGTNDYHNSRPVYGTMTFSISGNANADAYGDLFMYFVE